jgi:pimeloyl-ACP methyl ester carboxylesterase
VSETSFIEYKGSTLFYRRSGEGANTLLLFHGFGQDHRAFAAWDESLSAAYTLYSFDIFFHGQSRWALGDTPLEKEDWKSILEIFLKSNNIGRFSLCGFSMGGKFVLATLESFPEKVQDVFLLAPDGIKTSGWYSLATYPTAFRNLFRSMISRPKRFYAFARFVNRAGLIDKSILRFAESQMDTKEKRQRVYSSWVVFRRLTFDMTAVTGIINAHHIHVVMVVGKFDRIITTKNMNRLLRKLNSHELSILDTGHNGIIADGVHLIIPFGRR